MNSKFLKLHSNDFVKGLIVTIIVVILGALQQALLKHGFDIMAYDWVSILDLAWKAGVAYLAKNLLTDEEETIHLGFTKLVKTRKEV